MRPLFALLTLVLALPLGLRAEQVLVRVSGPQSPDPGDENTRRVGYFIFDTDDASVTEVPIAAGASFPFQRSMAVGGPGCELYEGADFGFNVQRIQLTSGKPYPAPAFTRNNTFLPSSLRFLSLHGDALSVVDVDGDQRFVVETKELSSGDVSVRTFQGPEIGLRDATLSDGALYSLHYIRPVGSVYAWNFDSGGAELFHFEIDQFEPQVFEYQDGIFYIQGYVLTDGSRGPLVVRGYDEDGTYLGDFVPPNPALRFRELAVSPERIWVIDGPVLQGWDRSEGTLVATMQVPAGFGAIEAVATMGCTPDDSTARFQAGAFEASVTFETAAGVTGVGHALPTDSGSTARLWFFEPDNEELLLKVLDGCAINGHYWVFFAATTDVGFDLTVAGTRTGEEKLYANPLGQPANAVTDTEAFACGE